MPVRWNVIAGQAVEEIAGVGKSIVFDGRIGEPENPALRKPYDDAIALVTRLYDRIVERVDWNRVLLEATSRHIQLGHERETDEWAAKNVCGECLREAMLADDTSPSWTTYPTAALRRAGRGW